MTDRHEHWEQAYQSKGAEEQSWFQERPEISLSLIQLADRGSEARIIDIGGGASRLVDVLCAEGYRNLSVLDIATAALELSKQRLGEQAARVRWIAADITSVTLNDRFDVWHDRAVFHFLTEASDRAAYKKVLQGSLEVGGHAIIATFAEDGPTRCSGLPVVRYSPDSLRAELGEEFELVDMRRDLHVTPAGREQRFVYCLFRHTATPR